jgi:hypothetical protein
MSTALISHLEFMVFGAMIVFFLIVEPHGLARLWAIARRSSGCGRSPTEGELRGGWKAGHYRRQGADAASAALHNPDAGARGTRPARQREVAMALKILGAAAAAAVGGTALAVPALAQNEQFIPALVYRTGAYAPNGVPFANGVADYYKLVNARDNGINGVASSARNANSATPPTAASSATSG